MMNGKGLTTICRQTLSGVGRGARTGAPHDLTRV